MVWFPEDILCKILSIFKVPNYTVGFSFGLIIFQGSISYYLDYFYNANFNITFLSLENYVLYLICHYLNIKLSIGTHFKWSLSLNYLLFLVVRILIQKAFHRRYYKGNRKRWVKIAKNSLPHAIVLCTKPVYYHYCSKNLEFTIAIFNGYGILLPGIK